MSARQILIENLSLPINERQPVAIVMKKRELTEKNNLIFNQIHAEIQPQLEAMRQADELLDAAVGRPQGI